MSARPITNPDRATGMLRVVVTLVGALAGLSAARVSAAPLTDVYATYGTYVEGSGYSYGFGTFDLANPTGSPGSYSYAWTTLLSPASPTLNVLARNSATGAMVLQYGDTQFRSISTGGALSGNLGSIPTYWGMAFDGGGSLFAYYAYGDVPEWRRLNPADGQTLTTGTLTGDVPAPYSAGGGNLAPRPAGGFYFLNQYPGPELVRLIPTGNDVATVLIGALSGAGFNPDNMHLSIFASGTSLYLLQDADLFAVDQSTAALAKLGTVTGVPADFYSFTGAAGMIEVVPVPEPSTVVTALIGLSAAAEFARRRRRRYSRP